MQFIRNGVMMGFQWMVYEWVLLGHKISLNLGNSSVVIHPQLR
jgi:hypothetical protein